jgi:hypothetical protein
MSARLFDHVQRSRGVRRATTRPSPSSRGWTRPTARTCLRMRSAGRSHCRRWAKPSDREHPRDRGLRAARPSTKSSVKRLYSASTRPPRTSGSTRKMGGGQGSVDSVDFAPTVLAQSGSIAEERFDCA